ncbi:MAG: LysR family transcriptional regulator [Dongiaceae bacterium]
MRAPDPDLLRTFVTIVDSGSFTAAARRVRRTQSAVSMQMRRLEADVGARLFERSGRAMKLTPAGEVLVDRARRILRLYEQALNALDSAAVTGEISVGVPDDYAMTFLPEILRRIVGAFPAVHLTILCEPSRRLAARIAEGSLDIALLTEGEGSAGGVVVHHEELVWVTAAHAQVHEQDPVPIAVFHSGDVFRRYAIQQLEETGRRARVIVTSPTFAGIRAAVDAGIAVAPIFRRNVRAGMRMLTVEEGYPHLPSLGIVLQRADREPRELIDRLANHVIDSARELSETGALST